MPLAAKIFILIAILAIVGYSGYTYVYNKFNPEIKSATEQVVNTLDEIYGSTIIAFRTNDVIKVKCKDSSTISLYLEDVISRDEYKGTLMAVQSFPSTQLTVKNQELTFVVNGVKLKVYQCQMYQGILIGKLTKI